MYIPVCVHIRIASSLELFFLYILLYHWMQARKPVACIALFCFFNLSLSLSLDRVFLLVCDRNPVTLRLEDQASDGSSSNLRQLFATSMSGGGSSLFSPASEMSALGKKRKKERMKGEREREKTTRRRNHSHFSKTRQEERKGSVRQKRRKRDRQG